MNEQILVRMLFMCDLGPGSGDTANEMTRGRLLSELLSKNLTGFLVSYNGQYLGLIEGRQRKVINLIEKLVRKGVFQNMKIQSEADEVEPLLSSVETEVRRLSDLPEHVFERCETLAGLRRAEVQPL